MKIAVVCIGLHSVCGVDKNFFYKLGVDISVFSYVENNLNQIRNALKFSFEASDGLCVLYSKNSWPNLQKTMLMEFERSSVFVNSSNPYVIANGFKEISSGIYFDTVYKKPFLLLPSNLKNNISNSIISNVLSSSCLTVGIFKEQVKSQYTVYSDETGTIMSVNRLHFEDSLKGIEKNKVYTTKGETAQEALFNVLQDRNIMVSIAESCTAGLISAYMADIPGISRYLKGGCVTYSNDFKSKFLGVNSNTLNSAGAVSREVAIQMALGILNNAKSDFSVAVTGIAGPSGETENKPVGLVYISAASRNNVDVEKKNFSGNREIIRRKTAIFALLFLRDFILRQ